MKNIIGLYNPYGLVQKAGKRRHTITRKRKSLRRHKKTRRYH